MEILLEPRAKKWIRQKGADELRVEEIAGAGGAGCCSYGLREMVADFGKPVEGRNYCRIESEGFFFYVPEHLCMRYAGLRIFLQDLKLFKTLKAVGVEKEG